MPKMNGLEVQKQLKKISPASRVVIVTSKDDPSVRAEAMGNGAYAFFLKPVDDDEFIAALEEVVSEN
jgi:DNA-binding NarL/FixJ family response regulator